jgi:hypothetical protein
MLNTKYYIIPDEDGKPVVRKNLQALGNAWFVEGIRMVDSADDEISALENFDPRADAIVHRDFERLVKGFDPVKNGTITLTEYAPDKLKYVSSSTSDQLAVFSEVWYGPDKGWHAYIDGQPAELLRANYILRALNVPSGEHQIELVFHPARYYTLKTLSLIISLLIIGGILFLVYRVFRQQQLSGEIPDHEKVTSPGRAVKRKSHTHGRKK